MTTMFSPLDNDIILPERLNCPFYYEPHPSCLFAFDHVKREIEAMDEWRDEIERGKMFGVLVARDADGRAGYVKAYSGQICGREDWDGWVPAVFDYLQTDGHFVTREKEITAANREIENAEQDIRIRAARHTLSVMEEEGADRIEAYRDFMTKSKAERKRRREEGENPEDLTRESQFQKAELKRMKLRIAEDMKPLETMISAHEERIAALRRQRKTMSDSLQRWLFSQFAMLNGRGERRTLLEIFAPTPQGIPPSGAGECCAPKLLQYAFLHNMTPLAIAEFWWGRSPNGEIRHHLSHYPACQGKCRPILDFMLEGVDAEPNPLHADETVLHLNIIYQDEWLVVIDKPAGMLSVPGKGQRKSAQEILAGQLGESGGGIFCIHRLDMQTSGLLMFARTESVQQEMQRRFAMRDVEKCYTALVDGRWTKAPEGTISLPLAPDYMNRPRQKADHENGKEAVTAYRVLESGPDSTRLALYPKTGRTHQLRVHCAHNSGLAMPITGDDLYGRHDTRLMLHATTLDFTHPVTGIPMHLESPCPF